MVPIKTISFIILFILFVLFIAVEGTPPTGKVLVNKLSYPDFVKYHHLVLRTKDLPTYDFSESRRVTYYYSFTGTEIPFSIRDQKYTFIVKSVEYDKEGKEYASIEVQGSHKPIYETLYEAQEKEIVLSEGKITLIAESIIDHDNIEYLTIIGQSTKEDIPSPTPQPESIQEQTETYEPEEDALEKEIKAEIRQETPKKSPFGVLEIGLLIFNIMLLVVAIILGIRRRNQNINSKNIF